MRTVILIILSLLLVFTKANAQDTDTISVEQAKVKTKTFFDELFMFRMAADVLETRALISDNELGDSVENYMTNYDNALFFISRLEYDFFWNNLLGRKKYKVPSSKLFLDSKDSYISKSEPGSSIDFDIVLTPQWVDPATEEKLKDYKVQINTANYTNLALTSEEKENLNTILNSPFTKNYGTPKDAEVNEAVFKGLAELRRLLAEAQKPVEIGLQLDFKPYESQQFGFDKLSYDVHKPSYIIRTYNGKEMYLPWKSISSSGIDQVLVEVADADNNYSPGDVKFKTSTGTTVSATPFEGKDKLFLVNVTGKTNEEVEEIQAYVNYEIDEETQKEVVIGGLNTISYDKQSISLIIVPVNKAAPFSASQFTTKLNEIYKQSVVEWKVTLDDVFEISESEWDQDGDHKMNDGESTFLSDYSDEQLALKLKYKQERDIDKQAYYVFLLNNIPSKSGLEGYMPLKKQYAYIHSATSENAAQLIAHELGHGAFRLWHTFSSESDFFMAQKSSDNLMDYNKGTHLHKYQWDHIHNPESGIYLFQDESEAAMIADDIIEKTIKVIRDNTVEGVTSLNLSDFHTTTYEYGVNVPKHGHLDFGNDNKFDISYKIFNLLSDNTKNKIKISEYSEETYNRKYLNVDGQCLTILFDYKDRSGVGLEMAVPVAQKDRFKDYLFAAMYEEMEEDADSSKTLVIGFVGNSMGCNIGTRTYLYLQKNETVLFPTKKSSSSNWGAALYCDSIVDEGCHASEDNVFNGDVKNQGQANDIYDGFEDESISKFSKIANKQGFNYPDFEKLQTDANNGVIIVGVKKDNPNGHVVVLIPSNLNENSTEEIDHEIGDDEITLPIALECGTGNKEIRPFKDKNNIINYIWYKYE